MNRFTRSILLALVAVAAFAVPTLSHAQAAPEIAHKQLKFRYSSGGSYFLKDSCSSIGRWIGAQDFDTTAAVYIGDIRHQGPISSTGAITATNALRLVLNITATSGTSDTLFVLPQYSSDGSTWAYNATYKNLIPTSGYPSTTAFSLALTQDADALGSAVDNAHLWRYVRFVIRADGDQAVSTKINKAFLDYDSASNVGNLRPQTP